MPKVLLDLRMVRGRVHGIARYALSLAERLPRIAPGSWSFEALVPPEGLGPETPLALPVRRARAPFLDAREQLDLPLALLRSGCDLFHATSFSLPALWPGPLIATLHDANHLDLSEEYGWRQRAYYAAVVLPRAHTARALLTVSRFSQTRLAQGLRLSPERFQVVAPGVDERFHPQPGTHEAPALPSRYFLAVGNDKAFKNLSLLARIAPRLPAPLVLLAGPDAASRWGLPKSTVSLDQVPESAMPALYAGARGLLLPSRYEGFGLPALEAMACGCPVVAAHAGALPEVVADAGLLVDPDDDAAWLAAVREVEGDRSAWVKKALRRAATFSWDRCARETLSAYARALETRA